MMTEERENLAGMTASALAERKRTLNAEIERIMIEGQGLNDPHLAGVLSALEAVEDEQFARRAAKATRR